MHRIGLYYPNLRCGGVQRVVAFQASLFARMGYAVTIFLDDPDIDSFFPLPETVRVLAINCEIRKGGSGKCGKIDALRNLLVENPVDVFYSHFGSSPDLEQEIQLVKVELGIPFMLHRHTMFNSELFSTSSEARRIFVISHRVHRYVDVVFTVNRVDAAYEMINGANAVYVPNPICAAEKIRRTSHERRKNVLWVGRFNREKGPCDAIRVFEKVLLEVPDSRLIIVGGGHPAFEADMKAEIRRRACAANVVLKSPSIDLDDEYEDASVCIITSITESFSLVAIEALSRGVPVVSYSFPAIEPFRDNRTVVQVEHGDIEGMASAVSSFLKNGISHARIIEIKESVKPILDFDHQSFWSDLFQKIESDNLDAIRKPVEEETLMLLVGEYHRAIASMMSSDVCSFLGRVSLGRFLMCLNENGWRYALMHILGKILRFVGVGSRL